jgi:hypothetical protein
VGVVASRTPSTHLPDRCTLPTQLGEFLHLPSLVPHLEQGTAACVIGQDRLWEFKLLLHWMARVSEQNDFPTGMDPPRQRVQVAHPPLQERYLRSRLVWTPCISNTTHLSCKGAQLLHGRAPSFKSFSKLFIICSHKPVVLVECFAMQSGFDRNTDNHVV